MEAVAFLFALAALLFMALAPVSLVLAVVAMSRVNKLERRIEELRASLKAAREVGAIRRDPGEEFIASRPAVVKPAPTPEDDRENVGEEFSSSRTTEPEPEPPVLAPEPDPIPIAAKAVPPPEPRRKPISLETVGVWAASALGGFILLVAGFLMFKLAIDKGWLGPEVRFAGGLGFGMLCIALAEGLWAKHYRLPAAGLGGAGLGILYAALYAGHAWYELLGMSVTFALMALVTATGVTWAVKRRSQFVATLGLLGGYLTPVMLSTGENKALALFGYTALLLSGLLVASVKRGWWALTGLAGLASAGVLLGWELKFHSAEQAPVAFGAALLLGGLLWITAWWERTPRFVGWAAALGAVLVPLMTLPYLYVDVDGWRLDGDMIRLITSPPSLIGAGFLLLTATALPSLAVRKRWPMLALLGALSLLPGLLVFCASWLEAASAATGSAPPLVNVLLLGSPLLAWMAARLTPALPAPELAPGPARAPQAHHAPAAVLLVTATVALPLASSLDAPAQLAGLCTGLILLGWVIATGPGPRWLPLAVQGLVAGGLYVAMLFDQPGLLISGAGVVLLSLAAPFALHAWARTRALTAAPLPWLAAALAGPLLFLPMHAGWEHSLGSDAIGLLPLALGVVTVAAAVMLREHAAHLGPRTRATFIGVGLLFACLAVPVQLDREWWTVGWALEGAALAWLSTRARHPGVVLLSLALLASVTARLVLNLEVLSYHPAAGGSLLNWTLYGYGVPVLALLAAAWWLRPSGDDPRVAAPWGWLRIANPAVVLMAVAVAFVLINLEVSAAFPEGEKLHLWSSTLEASMTRSISWAVYGLLLLLPGQRAELRYLRPVALGLLMMAALKVFLLDLWQLSGFVRVGSLFGVAVTLIVAALAFQRLVLQAHRREEREEESS
jgi:uncharacterized membrane protein